MYVLIVTDARKLYYMYVLTYIICTGLFYRIFILKDPDPSKSAQIIQTLPMNQISKKFHLANFYC